MALKHYNPVTPGQRGLVLVERKDIWSGKPEKGLTVGLKKKGGRNNTGRITVRHIGGGHKRRYRLVDFRRNKLDVVAEVLRIEYDPNRTAFIALVEYEDKEKSYILAPNGLSVGDKVVSSTNGDIKTGNTIPLINIPVGTIVHNIEIKPAKGGQLARSAGAYGQIIGKDRDYVQIRLNSSEIRLIDSKCLATIGSVSNTDHRNINDGKAGRNRWKGIRPTVRGTAMNPVDHPHGGGQGKTSGGRHPVTPWGKSTKGKKTRSNKRTDRFIVRRRDK